MPHLFNSIAFSSNRFLLMSNKNEAINGRDVIQLPTNDASEEIIRPFVIKVGGAITPTIPHES